MSFVDVQDIPPQAGCGNNTPGLQTLRVIEMSQLVTPLPAADAGTRTITTDFALVGAIGFAEWNFILQGSIHTETPTDNGLKEHSVKANFAKDDDLKRYQFNEMSNPCCKYGALYTDQNGVTKFIPDLTFRNGYTTGEGDSNQRNEFNAEFFGTGHPAFIYEGIIPTP